MEFFNFYQTSILIATFFTSNEKLFVLVGLIAGFVLWTAMFLLQGAGLYVMAKRCGLKRKGLALVPFANIYYMGKIAGTCHFFGHKMKNTGLYAMLAQIFASLACVLCTLSEAYLYYNHGMPQLVEQGMYYGASWTGLTGFSAVVLKCYDITSVLMSLTGLIAQILLVVLLIGLYKKYAPKNYRVLAVVSFIIPMARFITVFVLRGREPIDYEEYMRRMQEAYIRRQQQYYNAYGNPYNNPYGRPPYGNGQGYGNYQPPQPPPQEEPFEEFSSDGKQVSSDADENSDGFFD